MTYLILASDQIFRLMCKYVDKIGCIAQINLITHNLMLKYKEPKNQTAFNLLAARAEWCWVWLTADVSRRSIGSLQLESVVSHRCRGSHQRCLRRLRGVFLHCYCGSGDHQWTPAVLRLAEPSATTMSWTTALFPRALQHREADELIGSFLCDRQGHPAGVRTHLKRWQIKVNNASYETFVLWV